VTGARAGREAVVACVLFAAMAVPVIAQELPFPPPVAAGTPGDNGMTDIWMGLVRLPLAGALGTVLALRPTRRGTPTRTPAVVQTQIILAVVGAVIMLVVGSSLARAFGIVGAANLIRYRAKIDDPKDAGVMLCTLAVGLASGVGLYALAIFSAAFMLVVLWVIESFEPRASTNFELTVDAGEEVKDLRKRVESVLDRFHLEFELRTAAADKVVYAVKVPFGFDTETVTNALLKLEAKTPPTVDWDEKKPKSK
jgi:uncharacterized membrane protein YhiD involved in acid resistance